MQRQVKIAFFISNECKNRVSITRIWNRVMNFGSGSGYPVPATNHYFRCWDQRVKVQGAVIKIARVVGVRNEFCTKTLRAYDKELTKNSF